MKNQRLRAPESREIYPTTASATEADERIEKSQKSTAMAGKN